MRGCEMQESVKVAVDAMGGDNSPGEIVKGTIDALLERPEVEVFLVGKQELLKKELEQYQYPQDRLHIVNAGEVITNDEAPVLAIRRKKDSSIVVAMSLVKNGAADAFVSAGSTGAVLVGAQLVIGRIKGVERPPLAPLIPTMDGVALLVDCGANVDARASHLVQFAKMGSIYMENVVGIKNPRVALVNIGVEEEKGNMLVKETFPLLKNCNEINFIGSIESREIPNGAADVIVAEAFVGNVILKLYEGLAMSLVKKIKQSMTATPLSTLGAALVKPQLKKAMQGFDLAQYGGAPMLGLNGLVIKSHGSSKGVEIKNSILQCITFKQERINEKIAANIAVQERI